MPTGWVRSDLAKVVWPAFQAGARAEALAIQFQLEQSQWWSPERLRSHQFAQLSQLVRHAGETVPFYRERFKSIGFDCRAPLDGATWSRLPILTRREIQESSGRLQSERYPESHGMLGETGTSGSTATPITVKKARLQKLFWDAVSLRDHLWHRRDLAGRHANIAAVHHLGEAAYPDGTAVPNWGSPVGPFRSGPGNFLAIVTPIEQQIEWLSRVRPDYLNTFPSNLDALARHYRDHGDALPSLKGLRTASEVLRPDTRALCREVFGLEIADMYSSAELGYVALQSPDSEELLIQSETILVEVLDDADRPCRPGQVGRVIATPLHGFAMPLLRYASGDLAEVGGAASCGRGLPVINRVLGRERQMITLPTGERFWPSFLGVWEQFEKLRQFQIVRTAEAVLEIRLAVRAPFEHQEEEHLRHELLERFRYPFEVKFVYLDMIPRERSGKYLDFKSEVD